MLIEVTQEHIDAGKRRDCAACPIVLALNEQAPRPNGWALDCGFMFPMVFEEGYKRTDEFFKGWRDEGKEVYWMPESVMGFVGRFDDGYTVQPFAFNLDLQ